MHSNFTMILHYKCTKNCINNCCIKHYSNCQVKDLNFRNYWNPGTQCIINFVLLCLVGFSNPHITQKEMRLICHIIALFIIAGSISSELPQERLSEVLNSYKLNENSLFGEMRERPKLNRGLCSRSKFIKSQFLPIS